MIGNILSILSLIAVIVGSILYSTSDIWVFVNIPSIVIVLGGSIISTFLAFDPFLVVSSFSKILKTFFSSSTNIKDIHSNINTLIEVAKINSTKGLIGVENLLASKKIDDEFLDYALNNLLLKGYSSDDLIQVLDQHREKTYIINDTYSKINKNIGESAPAFGMVGTLIGLIIMLQSLGNDPEGLGSGMAVALITTLYGVLLSRVVFLPLSQKMQTRNDLMNTQNELISIATYLISKKASTQYIKDRMNSFLRKHLQI